MFFKRIAIALFTMGALCVNPSSLFAVAESSTTDDPIKSVLRDDSDPASEFMVSTWKTSEGLPVNEIQELEETADGYLWLGTHQGLVRFDGLHFRSFYTEPVGARYGTRVGSLEVDAHDRLWFAPDQVGLVYRHGENFTEVLTNSGVLKARVTSLTSDGTNHLYWVNSDGGVGRISTERPIHAKSIPGGNGSFLSHWIRDYEGALWLQNVHDLKLYREGKLRDVPLPGTASLVATARRAGGLWVARDAKLRFVTADGKSHDAALFPWKGQSRVVCMLEDHRQRLWIGTTGQGLFCYTAGEFKQVLPKVSTVTSLLEDAQENLWVATRGGGLLRVRQRQFFMHDVTTGLANEFVRSLAQDKAGRIWLLMAEGEVGWWQDGVWHPVGKEDGWRNYDSTAVLPASDGSVWISTLHRGFWRWVDGKVMRREVKNFPKDPAVDLLEDRHGRLWMVTDNSGVFCLDGDKLTGYSTAQGLPSKHIRQMIEDEDGVLWAGDWMGGIARFNDNHWEIVRKPSGHGDAVRCMTAENGALWIGTSAGGLLRFKNGQTRRVSLDDGMPSACIQQLLLDGRGSLWGGTPHRLFRLSLPHLNAVMDGKQPRVEPIVYGRSDGLPDGSIANWCDPRNWRTREGELWFATANGAIHFRPENLHESKPPPTLLEQTLVDGKPVSAETLQHLRPGSGKLEIRFTAPCLTAAERVHFRYQMSGIDADWVDAGTTRSVTYGSVPAGSHTFRVVASSPEGVWGSHPAFLALAVHPYFWQTNWFLAAVAALLAGGTVWMVRRASVQRLRHRLALLRQQQAVDRERARIAQDIHDELGANLTSIGLLADMGTRHKTDPAAVTHELDQISQTARESVAAMDAIVWALNPRNDSLDHFANYISQFTREFFRPTSIRTRLDLPIDLPVLPMATETRHQLFLIVKEAFNNIVRHSAATEVNVELACRDAKLHLTIADNGKGLSQPAGAGQDGLANLRHRIEALGGTLQIESKGGQGTKLKFLLPMTQCAN